MSCDLLEPGMSIAYSILMLVMTESLQFRDISHLLALSSGQSLQVSARVLRMTEAVDGRYKASM